MKLYPEKPTFPLTDQWIYRLWYCGIMKYHLAIKTILKYWSMQNLDDSQNNFTKRKKPDYQPQKEYIVFDSILQSSWQSKQIFNYRKADQWLTGSREWDRQKGGIKKEHKRNWSNNEYVSMLIVVMISQVCIKIKLY